VEKAAQNYMPKVAKALISCPFQGVEKSKRKGGKQEGKKEKSAPVRMEEPEILIVDELVEGSKSKPKKKKSKKNKAQTL